MVEDSPEEDSECPPLPKRLCVEDVAVGCEEMKDEGEAETERKRGKLSKYVYQFSKFL